MNDSDLDEKPTPESGWRTCWRCHTTQNKCLMTEVADAKPGTWECRNIEACGHRAAAWRWLRG